MEVSAQALAIQFLYLKCPRALALKSIIHAGFGAPQKPLALWKRVKKIKRARGQYQIPSEITEAKPSACRPLCPFGASPPQGEN